MPRMLPEIDTLEQHQKQVLNNPDAYRPECCSHCGKAGLHHHGYYERNVPKGEGMAFVLGVLIILRFICPGCRHTCSCLPGCLSPRRHYWWKSQQEVLQSLITGKSIYQVEQEQHPCRHTIGRWWRRLEACFDEHALYLRSRFPALGRTVDWRGFWSLCFNSMSLAAVMGWLDHVEVSIP